MAKPEISIKSLVDILTDSTLHIPEYQRPYSWTTKQVEPLLKDLSANTDAPIMMGSIILHKDEHKQLNIVDGQQRLVTFSMLNTILELDWHSQLLSSAFPHAESQQNITQNAAFIRSYLKKRNVRVQMDNIFFVALTTKNINDAFSFFDTQNTRGKPLKSYDILKAHHLRYIGDYYLAQNCAENWELIEKDENVSLSLLLETLLGRGRKWSANDRSLVDIREEFKAQRTTKRNNGIYSMNKYQQPALFTSWCYNPANRELGFFFTDGGLIKSAVENQLKVNNDNIKSLPFQIGQSIEGGELFFWYTQKYYALIKELFADDNQHTSPSFKELISQLRTYNSNGGTRYVFEVYQSAMLFYIDKFGYDDLDIAAADMFFCIYWLRFRQYGVQNASVGKYIRETFNPFSLIRHASYTEYLSAQCSQFLEDKDFRKPISGSNVVTYLQDNLIGFNTPQLIRNHQALQVQTPNAEK